MEYAGFLVSPHQKNSFLNILSWNINGAKTKLEKLDVFKFLLAFDIISLNESKSPLNISIPGYVSFRSKRVTGNASLRGGTIVMVKNYLANQVYNIDNSMIDQVWFQLRCIPSVMFGFCYIPPTDSIYFSHQLFANLNDKIIDYKGYKNVCIIGDMNARFGRSVCTIPSRSNNPDIQKCSYPIVPDEVVSPNDSAFLLSSICTNNDLVVLNNVKTSFCNFPSKKTFKRSKQWVSEIDTVVASFGMLSCFESFSVHQTDWLPSNHAPISINVKLPNVNLELLLSRAEHLGGHGSLTGRGGAQERMGNRPVRYEQIDVPIFLNKIRDIPIPINYTNDVNELANNISKILYDCGSSCTIKNSVHSGVPGLRSNTNTHLRSDSLIGYNSRWDQLLQDPDDARVWKALDWKGQFIDNSNNTNQDYPSDAEFQNLYETQINQHVNDNQMYNHNDEYMTNIPVLDNYINPVEVTNQIQKMKSNKSCGPDGIPPGIYKLLNPEWIILLTTLFNLIFTNAIYPLSWSNAKLFMLFKRGDRKDPNNYRGISIINSIAKFFDMVLCNRLELWFKPYREQAGAQKGRGCIEHIVTLRLLIDYAKKKKIKLFITFVDFSKAYDVVPRDMLFMVLRQLGCGAAMLSVIVAMYSVTKSILGTAIISTLIGVRQGSPTSCLLFIIYVNELIKLLKETCQPDGFLSWLHLLMLMDDTVLLATNRESIIKKVQLLNQFCMRYGMIVNENKTKLMVINGNICDRQPISINDLTIKHCDKYIYLGSPFTADGSLATVIKIHVQEKMPHFHKFMAFLNKNNDLPFVIKKRVFDACLLSAILYGCESWLNGNLKPVVKIYNWALKQLLGVRLTTCNDVCYIESGYSSVNSLVKSKQRTFFAKMYNERYVLQDDPLGFSLKLVLGSSSNTKRYLYNLINIGTSNVIHQDVELLKNNLRSSESSRRKIYCNAINSNLAIHNVYTSKHNIYELYRIAFTRFRVSSHMLAVETGRWNRRGRGRLPMEERLCSCGLIQSEEHVISFCPLSQSLRDNYGFTCINDLMTGSIPNDIVCKIIYEVLEVYK